MFLARVRWVGRVLDGAGIDTNSKTGRELTSTLVAFSKYCQEKNRRGDGAGGVRLNLSPAEWALLAAILAAVETRVTDQLSAALNLSEADVSTLLAKVRESSLALAKQKMPDVLASITSK